MSKPKVAFYWCASCGGCEEAVVDLNEDMLKVVGAVDIIFWPVAMDFKKKDVESYADNEIDVSFINGAVRTDEQREMVELLRRRSKIVVAFGSCAHIGGIPGLANFFDKDFLLDYVYKKTFSTVNEEGILPQTSTKVKEGELELPGFHSQVKCLDQVIDVDYYIPGCAPPADLIMKAVMAILEGQLPPKGTVLAPEKALCDTCPLADSKPEKMSINQLKRPHLVKHDPEKCFLAEGIICLGPATRTGCGERCINANMPCRGCFGPSPGVMDHGAKIISAISSIIGIENEEYTSDEEVDKILESIVDPGGLFYLYSLPSSLLKGIKNEDKKV